MMWLSKKSSPRLLACVFALLLGLSLTGLSCKGETSGQDMGGARPQASEQVKNLLPAEGTGEGWKREGEARSFAGESLFDHIDGGADIYFEYGFDTLVTQAYRKGESAASAEIYGMEDPPAAFGIYSYNRHPALSGAEVGSDATIHSNGLFFWQDKYYVEIRQMGAGKISPGDFLSLAKAVSRKIGAEAPQPGIMKLLPTEDMVPRSAVFARGKLAINNQVYVGEDDLFGLGKGEAAAIARYRFGHPEFSLIIAEYGSREACERAFLRFRKHFLGDESTKENEFAVLAMPGKHDAVRMAGNRLIVVANADSRANALDMLDRVANTEKSE